MHEWDVRVGQEAERVRMRRGCARTTAWRLASPCCGSGCGEALGWEERR